MKSERFAENITIETEDQEEMVENNMDTNNINDDTANNLENESDDNMIPVMMLGLGYPNENSKPNPWHFKRGEIGSFVKYI